MNRRALCLLVALLLLCPAVDAKILGVFQGTIVKTPSPTGGKRYLLIQGKSGFVRKVDVTKATVEYDEDFPTAIRSARPAEALTLRTEVRVTAQQKKDVWLADEVLILAPRGDAKRRQAASLRMPSR